MDKVLTIHGEVIDSEGEGVSAATISLQAEGLNLKSLSSFEGQFRFRDISPGTYSIKAHHEDFGKVEVKNLELVADGESFITLEFE